MEIQVRPDGLVVKNRFYQVTLAREGGRIVSFVHAGAGTEFTGNRGLSEELECGHPGQMAHDPAFGILDEYRDIRLTIHRKTDLGLVPRLQGLVRMLWRGERKAEPESKFSLGKFGRPRAAPYPSGDKHVPTKYHHREWTR